MPALVFCVSTFSHRRCRCWAAFVAAFEQEVPNAMPAGVRVDADVPQGCEIVTSLQHVHAPRPMGNDSPAALITHSRVCGDNRPVRQVTLLGPARGRLKSVLVLRVWHSHVTLGEPPTARPVMDRLRVEDRRHHKPAGRRARTRPVPRVAETAFRIPGRRLPSAMTGVPLVGTVRVRRQLPARRGPAFSRLPSCFRTTSPCSCPQTYPCAEDDR